MSHSHASQPNDSSNKTGCSDAVSLPSPLRAISQHLLGFKVEWLRVEYASDKAAGVIDVECYGHQGRDSRILVEPIATQIIEFFVSLLLARCPEWFDPQLNTGHGVFEWNLQRNTLTHRHVDPAKDVPPRVQHGF